jgi:uncharacterized protein with PIN domain
MFCPECGSLLEESPKVMQSLQARTWPSKDLSVQFYACVKCKRLLMWYGGRGFYFDILGTLSDEFVAVLVAASLGKNERQ